MGAPASVSFATSVGPKVRMLSFSSSSSSLLFVVIVVVVGCCCFLLLLLLLLRMLRAKILVWGQKRARTRWNVDMHKLFVLALLRKSCRLRHLLAVSPRELHSTCCVSNSCLRRTVRRPSTAFILCNIFQEPPLGWGSLAVMITFGYLPAIPSFLPSRHLDWKNYSLRSRFAMRLHVCPPPPSFLHINRHAWPMRVVLRGKTRLHIPSSPLFPRK